MQFDEAVSCVTNIEKPHDSDCIISHNLCITPLDSVFHKVLVIERLTHGAPIAHRRYLKATSGALASIFFWGLRNDLCQKGETVSSLTVNFSGYVDFVKLFLVYY